MPVFRVEKNKGCTVMSNFHLRDKRLSLKAKDLLSQILSFPEAKADIFFYQLSVSIHLIHPHTALGPASRGGNRQRGGRGKDGWVSIALFRFIFLSLIRDGKTAAKTAAFHRCRLMNTGRDGLPALPRFQLGNALPDEIHWCQTRAKTFFK